MSSATTQDLPLVVRLLLEGGKLTEEQLEHVRKARNEGHGTIEEALVLTDLVSETAVAEAHARHLGLSWVELRADASADVSLSAAAVRSGTEILMHAPGEERQDADDGTDETASDLVLPPYNSEHHPGARVGDRPGREVIGTLAQVVTACSPAANIVSENVCRRHLVVPLRYTERSLDLACLNPSDYSAIEEVSMRSGIIVRPVAATLGVITELTAAFFGERDVVREIASEASQGKARNGEDAEEEDMQMVLDLQRPIPAGRDSQVVRIVNVLLSRSIEEGASDIHIEPYEDKVRVRYRIDGKLVETTPPPRSLFIPTISRLKILAKMDIAEKRIPQDGAIALKIGEKRVDLRVSTVPTVYGEKMVIRLLEKDGIPDKMEKLGFSEAQAQAFLDAARAPNGLMFVTGPTGSGKSTTLYCCLNLINTPDDNIVTVEDPVEYKFYGLNQVHVRSTVGLTFSSALRAFLRQDPDKIMVGEVRDQETAEICMRAALTGHLVLSTLHTNDSLQVINRLTDMGIEPFLLGPALRLLEAQRLSRRLCNECKQPYELPEEVAVRHALPPGVTLYRPPRDNNNCELCRGNGTKGRVGIYEIVPITQEIGELIATSAPMTKIKEVARNNGVDFLADSARKKLLEGSIALEEVSEYVKER